MGSLCFGGGGKAAAAGGGDAGRQEPLLQQRQDTGEAAGAAQSGWGEQPAGLEEFPGAQPTRRRGQAVMLQDEGDGEEHEEWEEWEEGEEAESGDSGVWYFRFDESLCAVSLVVLGAAMLVIEATHPERRLWDLQRAAEQLERAHELTLREMESVKRDVDEVSARNQAVLEYLVAGVEGSLGLPPFDGASHASLPAAARLARARGALEATARVEQGPRFATERGGSGTPLWVPRSASASPGVAQPAARPTSGTFSFGGRSPLPTQPPPLPMSHLRPRPAAAAVRGRLGDLPAGPQWTAAKAGPPAALPMATLSAGPAQPHRDTAHFAECQERGKDELVARVLMLRRQQLERRSSLAPDGPPREEPKEGASPSRLEVADHTQDAFVSEAADVMLPFPTAPRLAPFRTPAGLRLPMRGVEGRRQSPTGAADPAAAPLSIVVQRREWLTAGTRSAADFDVDLGVPSSAAVCGALAALCGAAVPLLGLPVRPLLKSALAPETRSRAKAIMFADGHGETLPLTAKPPARAVVAEAPDAERREGRFFGEQTRRRNAAIRALCPRGCSGAQSAQWLPGERLLLQFAPGTPLPEVLRLAEAEGIDVWAADGRPLVAAPVALDDDGQGQSDGEQSSPGGAAAPTPPLLIEVLDAVATPDMRAVALQLRLQGARARAVVPVAPRRYRVELEGAQGSNLPWVQRVCRELGWRLLNKVIADRIV
eukprot:TRINITY_DN65992_c0_g1_i1.p1 TRINITY_DN65992_c0_g1~~TRINITY_DN65992_c0_g1_i1.p1  ORF type:complete len:734 (+),score=185.92 TRINITY_DN65992_c0_g1_i1:67-2202(+)